jgi:pyruvate carboxylase
MRSSGTPVVAPGDQVTAGDTAAKIEAMKMEASITTSVADTVTRVALADTRSSTAATSSW